MAISFTSPATGTVVVPSAFTSLNIQTPVVGLSTAGIIALIGEANSGPATSASTENIATNFFTPDQLGSVIAKYGSGNLVDAFRAAAAASNDGNIVGSPNTIYLFKTNTTTAASATLAELGQTAYGTLTASLAGTNGNLLQYSIGTSTASIEATTGTMAYMPCGLTYSLVTRLNGGSAVTVSIAANTAPSVLTSNTSSLQTSSLMVTGGVNRLAFAGLTATTAQAITATGNQAVFTLTAPAVFPVTPVAGDTISIPTGSVFQGAANANAGYWEVLSVTNTTTTAAITMVKLNNNTAVTATVAPVNTAVTAFTATVGNDMICYSPIQLYNALGSNRSSFTGAASTTASAAASGSTLVITLATATFGTNANATSYPRVNDNVYIPSGSALVGAGSANQGWYLVTAVTSNALTLSMLSNGTPVTVAATVLSGTPNTTDVMVLRTRTDGVQATLELFDGAGSNLPLSRALFNLGTQNAATALSTTILPVVEVGTDFQASASIVRALDNTQESYPNIGGHPVLNVGYLGTTATIQVASLTVTGTVTGGSGANFTAAVSSFPTINDLANYISTLTGWSAAPASAAAGLLPLSVLDVGTFNCCSSVAASAQPGRIKRDSYDFGQAIAGSPTVTFTATSNLGLPEVTSSAQLLSGGAKGATTAAAVAAAIDAMANINVNFIVPLFSQDATADITAGLTDPSSTYTISGINSYLQQHVVSLSGQVKRKLNRLAVGSYRGSFTNALAQAASLASARFAMTFQDVKNVSAAGLIVQYQPWMGAVLGASMQAVGLYKSINHKYANCTGIVSPQNDFQPTNYGQLQQALNGGLLTLEAPAGGGFRFVSDQTTYGKDGNFVFNSLQVMYTADYMALDLARSFDNFAVGQAVADISAPIAKGFLQAKMTQYLLAKLISPSNGAPAGYDSASCTLSGPVLSVAVNAYITNAISFVPITLSISQVQQSS